MKKTEPIAIAWLRRDLRLEDNRAIYEAHRTGHKILLLFIFDTDILSELAPDDHRVTFIHDALSQMNSGLQNHGSAILSLKGRPIEIWKKFSETYDVHSVHAGEDYEPYSIARDAEIGQLLNDHQIKFNTYKDHVIFEKHEVMKSDGTPYTVFTPYKNQWLERFNKTKIGDYDVIVSELNLLKPESNFPTLEEIGFEKSDKKVEPFDLSDLGNYERERNIPSWDKTSKLSPHLRFGTVSIRKVVNKISDNAVFLSELIWREFFMQILFHFPKVVDHNFKEKYNGIQWINNEEDFKKWCEGKTGYPMVDAGMRQLNATGYMHNRVRMITAGFLCKHLLIDWRWGEAYFAGKLFDYELASNNGNWQWSAGTGCDAAPYFRIFNPEEQLKKFDPELKYIKKWIPEFGTSAYPEPMVDHKEARARALRVYKEGLNE